MSSHQHDWKPGSATRSSKRTRCDSKLTKESPGRLLSKMRSSSIRPVTAILLSFTLPFSFLAAGCGTETSQLESEPAAAFSSYIEGVGTLSLRSPAEMGDTPHKGILHIEADGRNRDVQVEFEAPVFALTSVDPASGETLWRQSYRTIDGTRRYEVSEEANGAGLRWVREVIREGVWTETFYAIGVEAPPLQCTVDESSPETIQDARERLSAWLPAEVRDAVYDNLEGQIVNAIPRLLEENAGLMPDYAATTQLERIPEELWFEAVCAIAVGCSLVKCNFGGPLNPVCSMCFGVVITCAFCGLLNAFGISCT